MDNLDLKYKYWKPFWCWVLGHRITCTKVIQRYDSLEPDSWLWMCKRCISLWKFNYPCGVCGEGGRSDAERA